MKARIFLIPFNLIALTGVFTAMAQEKTDTAKVKLNDVQVSGRYYRKYTNGNLSSALRLQTPLLQLSQNIQTITPNLIRDQGAFNTTDAITRNVSGVVRQEVSNNLGPNIFMRGGQISALRNGIDLTPLYRGPVPDDAAIIESVEFIKGPSLFMNNMGDPAGSFNVMTKQPTGNNAYSISASVGSWDFYRLSADLDGTFDQSKKLQLRLNLMGMKSRSFVDFDNNDRLLIAPVLKYAINDHSFISAEYILQKFNYAMQSPIVMSANGFASLPVNFSIHESSLTPYTPTDQNAFVTYHNQWNKNWSLTARMAFLQNNSEGTYMWVTGVNAANPNILLRNPKYDLTQYIVYSQQAFVNGSIKTGTVTHHILAGADLNQKKFDGDSYVEYDKSSSGSLNYYPLDINNPVYGITIPEYSTPGGINNGNTHQTASYVSFYALDELLFLKERLRLTLGVRGTHLNTFNSVSGAITSSSDNVLTPRVGLSYRLAKELNVYVLHDQTFQPQTGVQGIATSTAGTTTYAAGNAIEPLKGDIWEAGVKKDWAGGKWNTTVSVYKIKRRNVAEAIPSTIFKNQIGSSEATGLDIDVKGELVKHLNIIVNYAYNDSKITESVTTSLIGARTPMYVKHIQNTWISYTLPASLISGLGISVGYQYMAGRGERYATATPHQVPDYFRLDAGINWHRGKISANLLINNLMGKNVIATPWYRNGLYYWVPNAPRNFRLGINYEI